MSTRYMESKYSGKCACGHSFRRGAMIRYDYSIRRVTGCMICDSAQCSQGPSDRHPDYSDIAYEDQCAAACGLDSLSGRDY